MIVKVKEPLASEYEYFDRAYPVHLPAPGSGLRSQFNPYEEGLWHWV